ncbi:MAG: fumarylacetoacetate hydrolase family protein [Candidatus Rokubacteria bacterium]|nr:fumarylacetoacetate hydrolase family protein [Candidatus Rokubacteria bacterium]
MKIVRFTTDGRARYGLLERNQVVECQGTPYGRLTRGRRRYPLKAVRLLPPCVPSKIVAVGLNYRDHAEEVGHAIPPEPIIFLKPSTALIGPGDDIVYPPITERVDYEAELAIVIRRRCRNVTAAEAPGYILGYTCLNDVTARDLQRRDGQWTRAKSFDTFSPMGPCIVTDIDPDNVEIEAYLNGERRQASNTKHFIFPVAEVISFVSRVMTLLPGDVISTGTPSGIGPMQVGDLIEIRIEGIGSLRNRLVAPRAR